MLRTTRTQHCFEPPAEPDRKAARFVTATANPTPFAEESQGEKGSNLPWLEVFVEGRESVVVRRHRFPHTRLAKRGSIVSRRPSPSMLMASTANARHTPG